MAPALVRSNENRPGYLRRRAIIPTSTRFPRSRFRAIMTPSSSNPKDRASARAAVFSGVVVSSSRSSRSSSNACWAARNRRPRPSARYFLGTVLAAGSSVIGAENVTS